MGVQAGGRRVPPGQRGRPGDAEGPHGPHDAGLRRGLRAGAGADPGVAGPLPAGVGRRGGVGVPGLPKPAARRPGPRLRRRAHRLPPRGRGGARRPARRPRGGVAGSDDHRRAPGGRATARCAAGRSGSWSPATAGTRRRRGRSTRRGPATRRPGRRLGPPSSRRPCEHRRMGLLPADEDGPLVEAAAALAERLLVAAAEGRGRRERAQGRRIARLLDDPDGLAFVLALTDEVLRIRDPRPGRPPPRRRWSPPPTRRRSSGRSTASCCGPARRPPTRLPAVVMPLVAARVRAEVAGFVVDAERAAAPPLPGPAARRGDPGQPQPARRGHPRRRRGRAPPRRRGRGAAAPAGRRLRVGQDHARSARSCTSTAFDHEVGRVAEPGCAGSTTRPCGTGRPSSSTSTWRSTATST